MMHFRLIFLIAAMVVTLSSGRANVVTFAVSGEFNNPLISMYHPPESLGGTLTVDQVTGVVTAADLTVAGFSNFTNIFHSFEFFVGTWTMTILNLSGAVLDFQFLPSPVPSSGQLVGLTSGIIQGGEIYVGCGAAIGLCHDWPNFPEGNREEFFGGNSLRGELALTSAVPETSTWIMMLLGFVSLGYFAYRRNGVALAA